MNKLNAFLLTLLINVSVMLIATVVTPAFAFDEIDQQINHFDQMADNEKALLLLDELLLSQKLSAPQKASALIVQGTKHISLTQFAKAIVVFTQAEKIATEYQLTVKQSQIHKMLGVIYYYQGDNKQALVEYKKSLRWYDDEGASLKRANLLNNMALAYVAMEHSTLALTTYQAAEALYQRFGDEIDKLDVRYNIAGLYLHLRRFDLAIKMFIEVIDKFALLNEPGRVAMASADLGVSYKDSGQYQLANKYMLAALEYFEQHTQKYNIASQMHNLSELYFEMNNIDKAKQYAEKGVFLSRAIGHNKAYSGSLQSLAKILLYRGDLDLALENIILANEIASKMGYQALLTDNLAVQSLIYASQNKVAQALTFHNKYEKQRHNAANSALNVQLAQFESTQLSYQVEQLKQNKKLQQLKIAKESQYRNFSLATILSLLIVSFLIYRRKIESLTKKELEIQVKQRTAALEISTKKLQQAGNVKNQFIANMSHEIRTPLTAIIGQAEAILYGDVSVNCIEKDVSIILANSLHLLQLTNEVLDLSKIEANKFTLELSSYDLHGILLELNNMFDTQARSKALTFNITHNLNVPFIVNCDCLRVKQILINLCSNAIKFTERGQVVFDINYENNTLVFSVTDTGIGMSAEQLAHVFDNFTQGDSSISRRYGGTGLGVFLSQQLAHVMGGNITVTSELNQGSVFTFTLPIQEETSIIAQTLALQNQKKCQKSSTKAATTLPVMDENNSDVIRYSGKVLLADDHDDNRRLVARLLSRLGLDVITARNGNEAVEQFIAHQPDLILLDIQMPEMDGIEALEKLQELGCRCPIYALTANAMADEVSHYLALGFNGTLQKPLEREKFVAIVTQHFNQRSEVEITNKTKGSITNTFVDNINNQGLSNQQTSSKLTESSEVNQSFVKNSAVNDIDIHENVVETDAVNQSNIEDGNQPISFGIGRSVDSTDLSGLMVQFIANLKRDKMIILTHFNNNDFEKLNTTLQNIAGAAQTFGFNLLLELSITLDVAINANDSAKIQVITLQVIEEIDRIQKNA